MVILLPVALKNSIISIKDGVPEYLGQGDGVGPYKKEGGRDEIGQDDLVAVIVWLMAATKTATGEFPPEVMKAGHHLIAASCSVLEQSYSE